MIKLVQKNFKTAIINMFKMLKEYEIKMMFLEIDTSTILNLNENSKYLRNPKNF